ncbi:hypothetical protein Cgig2_030518 [Carnegiea gigantea]|uniref:Uncharacterized protein n=1 Tax=Carnegiea gigantea TaxID=171969 RepID=A0A9Q1Q9M4_9CARY|nr:hypothetical protein Cgig2_030518 [Carnegiea gigantea]
MKVRSKKCAKANLEKKKEDVQKSPKTPVKSAQRHKERQYKIWSLEDSSTYKEFIQIASRQIYPYSVTLYILPDKRIETTPMDVHLILAFLIGGKKVEDFYRKKPKDAKYNEVLDNLPDGTPKLSQMPQYILSQTDAGKSFKRNFVLYMVSCFFNGLKNVY